MRFNFTFSYLASIYIGRLIGFDCGIYSSYLHHTNIILNPQSKYIFFTKKYNAIAAVVYYNPQSILVTFPINLGGFNSETPGFLQLTRGHCFNINCNIYARDFPNMYVLHPLAYGP